ncbi:ATP-binding response regulator [Burkholderia alba]|uniref:ATP-binding response regulator n=1 Tax=Burkholderia alba TaxID=2683677 RepID=UPI002B052C0F|nr:hybrid sensor histidine kinase/response regulator [Burkholderia alba]
MAALFAMIPMAASANLLAALGMIAALWADLPRHGTLAWVAALALIQSGWAAHALLRMARRRREHPAPYTRRDLEIFTGWWIGVSVVISAGLILCAPFVSGETHRMLLVAFCPGLIAAGALAYMMMPPISAVWLAIVIPGTCVSAFRSSFMAPGWTTLFLAIYAIPLLYTSLAISSMFVGRFKAELAAEREQRIVESMAIDLKRQKEIAEAASRAKSHFLAAASHDLRQPSHALSLFVGALRGVPMPPEGLRLVERIEASADAMDRLFATLLDISRLDAGVVAVHQESFAIDAVLARVCDEYLPEATHKGLTLSRAPCRAIVSSDPALVERIARNLISNAVRYTESGKIVVGCRRRGSRLAVQVWDTGKGIRADQQERVFEEYYQLDNPERDRNKGLGLGLAIVRRLATLLACELHLRSAPGRGSCFEILLEQAPAEQPATHLRPPIGETTDTAPMRGLVVVIDDEQAIRDAMATLLGHWGHETLIAGSAREALDRLAKLSVRPVLLICDLRLRGGEHGVEVIERLRTEYNGNIPAILVTGDTATSHLLELQASDLLVLHKPVPSAKLKAAIATLITPDPDAHRDLTPMPD